LRDFILGHNWARVILIFLLMDACWHRLPTVLTFLLLRRKTGMPRKGGFRHLVYFIDGTWLWPGSDDVLDVYSNIYRLNTLLNADDGDGHAQIVHYARGLGAVEGIRRYTSGGFAYGIDELVADLYVNICSNYERGDKLYIFGFSRGAVVARALTGLLSQGILEPQHINMFAHVWADYLGLGEVLKPGLNEDGPRSKEKIAEYKSFCSEPEPAIEFLGVFDTVVGGHGFSAVAQKLRLRERKLQPNVKNAIQLLAIDETRSFFSPIMWTGIREVDEPISKRRRDGSSLEQVWMPGVHADVGGGYSNRLLGDISLLTMIDRVMARTDLSFDLTECRKLNVRSATNLVRIHNEYTKLWRLFCPFPKNRQVDDQIQQFIHPFANKLHGQAVHYKGGRTHTTYELHPQFKGMNVAPEFLTESFESFC
jgi:uncharacterized protein (DUF2235 family)